MWLARILMVGLGVIAIGRCAWALVRYDPQRVKRSANHFAVVLGGTGTVLVALDIYEASLKGPLETPTGLLLWVGMFLLAVVTLAPLSIIVGRRRAKHSDENGIT